MITRFNVPYAFVICLLGIATSTCLAADPTPQIKPAVPPQPVVLPATVEPFEHADLYARTSGYISAVNFDIGDMVKPTDTLAVIDQPELKNDLAEAKATFVAKQKLVEAADAMVKQTEQSLEVAKQQVNRYQAEAKFQQVTLKRQEELFSGKAITDQQLDEARSKGAIAEADAGVAKAKVSAAEADLKGAQAAHAVAAAQADVAAAQVGRIETMMRYLEIKPPFEGVVSRRMVNRGDLALAAGMGREGALFTVVRLDKVRVRCDVPESVAGRIAIDTPAVIKLAGGQMINAKVTRSARALNPATRTMQVEIHLDNKDGQFVPGGYAQVTLTPQAVEAK